MSREMNRIRREAAEQYGPAPTTPAEALAHILAVYADVPDDRLMIEATNGIYGDGVRTGLTIGDLRALAADIERIQSAAADVSGIYDDGDTYGPTPV